MPYVNTIAGAAWVGMSPRQFQRYLQDGTIPSVKLPAPSRARRIKTEDLDAWIASRPAEPERKPAKADAAE